MISIFTEFSKIALQHFHKKYTAPPSSANKRIQLFSVCVLVKLLVAFSELMIALHCFYLLTQSEWLLSIRSCVFVRSNQSLSDKWFISVLRDTWLIIDRQATSYNFYFRVVFVSFRDWWALHKHEKKKINFGRYLTEFSFSEPFKVGRVSAHVSYNRFIFLDSTSEVL